MDFHRRFLEEGGVEQHPTGDTQVDERFRQRTSPVMVIGWLPINKEKTDWMIVLEHVDIDENPLLRTTGRFNRIGTQNGEMISDLITPEQVWEWLELARSSRTALADRLAGGTRDTWVRDIALPRQDFVRVDPPQFPALA